MRFSHRPIPFALTTLLLFWSVVDPAVAGTFPPQPVDSTPISASPGSAVQVEPRSGLSPGLLPALLALAPGFLLHGSGVFAIGERETALRLLALEGVGLFGMVAGTAVLAWTGASRRLTGAVSAVLMLGTGLFLTSMAADLYGAITGGTGAGPALRSPRVSLALGYRYVHDKQFAYRNLTRISAGVGLSRWQLDATSWVALDDANQRARLSTAYRPYGPIAGASNARDGSFVSVALAGTYHGYETEGFRTLTAEATVTGRYDLERLGRPLRGSFAEAQLGWGMEFYHYDVPGLSFGEDVSDMLLGGFAWGVYLGEASTTHGEIALFYDHRRDDYTGGVVSGFAGHFGLRGQVLFCPDERGSGWGVSAELEIGTAFFGGVDLFYQWGTK